MFGAAEVIYLRSSFRLTALFQTFSKHTYTHKHDHTVFTQSHMRIRYTDAYSSNFHPNSMKSLCEGNACSLSAPSIAATQ